MNDVIQTGAMAQTSEYLGVTSKRATQRIFDKIDKWRQVFELRTQGFSNAAIAKTLDTTERSVCTWYQNYIMLQSEVVQNKLTPRNQPEITEYLERLQFYRQKLALEVSTAKDGTPEKFASMKLLLEVEKMIESTKRGLGHWRVISPDAEPPIEPNTELVAVEKEKRFRELLQKVIDGSGA